MPPSPDLPAPDGHDRPATPPRPDRETVAAWLTLASSPDARTAWWSAGPSDGLRPATLVARLRQGGLPLREPGPAALERAVAWLTLPGNALLGWGDPLYPATLAALEDAPVVLFVSGDARLLSRLQVAIVGSRKPTPVAAEHAFRLARELAAAGVTVTSGVATGIDAAAHRGAIASQCPGATIGVLGSGPDVPYPRLHAGLFREIANAGLLVSEFPPGAAARPYHFPRRNRIISGLSRAVVVLEAGLPSGTLITARLALSQGREVLAVPGPPGDPRVRGCHALIRDGARLVEDAGQVLQELRDLQPQGDEFCLQPGGGVYETHPGPRLSTNKAMKNSSMDECARPRVPPGGQASSVLAAMGGGVTDIDSVVRRSGLTVSEVSSILASLELSGLVWAGPAGTFQRKPD
jgi:DNA processing protein